MCDDRLDAVIREQMQTGVCFACRSFCHGRYPYAQQASPRNRTPSPARGSMEVRELDDSYVLFIDVPGEPLC